MSGTKGVPAPDIQAVLAAARPPETTMRLCLAGDLAVEAQRLEDEIDRLGAHTPTSLADVDPRAGLIAQLDDVIARMRQAEVEFRFRALPRQQFSDLIARHPPKEEGEAWNSETFPVELVALSCISPPMTLEQAETLFDAVGYGGRTELWNAAWSANRTGVQIPTSRAASATPSSSGER